MIQTRHCGVRFFLNCDSVHFHLNKSNRLIFLIKYETPYSDFRLGQEGFNHTSSSNYEDRVEALLGNEEKVFSGIPSIEKKIAERVRKFLSFKLFDLF